MKFCLFFSCLIFYCLAPQICRAQAPDVINDVKVYMNTVKADSNQRMINIRSIKLIRFDLRYATSNNFLHQQLYPTITDTYLRLKPSTALEKAQKDFIAKGVGIKVFDAYRPYSVSKKMWNLIQDTRYVANPANGSGHNRGTAIDLTLIDLKTGMELDMGTPFDNFSDTAHHTFKKLPTHILNNRALLKKTMEKYGFKALATEWWHYTFMDTTKYSVLDISFEKLKELDKK